MMYCKKSRIYTAFGLLGGFAFCILLLMVTASQYIAVEDEYNNSMDAIRNLMLLEQNMPLECLSEDFKEIANSKSLTEMYNSYVDVIPVTVPFEPGVWYEGIDGNSGSDIQKLNIFRSSLQSMIDDSRINGTVRKLINTAMLRDSIYMLSSASDDYDSIVLEWYRDRDRNEEMILSDEHKLGNINSLQNHWTFNNVYMYITCICFGALPMAAFVALLAELKENKKRVKASMLEAEVIGDKQI